MIVAFIQRFELRLLLFLLLVGSIPLALASYVFYEQSTTFARNEQAERVELSHKQLIQRIAQDVDALQLLLHEISNDYAVQRFMAPEHINPLELKGLRDYIDYLLQQRLSRLRHVEQLCLTVEPSAQTICAQISDRQRSATLEMKVPVIESAYGTNKGSITAYISTEMIVQSMVGKPHYASYTITDASGKTVVHDGSPLQPESSWELPAKEREGQITSTETLNRPEGQWTSIMLVNLEPSDAYSKLNSLFVLLFLLLALIAVPSSIMFSRYVTKPLYRLQGLMKRAELGDLKAYWIDKGIAELNELGKSYNQMLNRLEELIKQVKLEEALKKEAEMESLQHQLNPHFLYNTLSTIKWVAKLHQTPQISEAVSALVRLLQASLGKKGDFLTIREEEGLMKDYMEIQAFRFGDRITLQTEIEAAAYECLVPRMILQPLVENAILHGIEPSKRPGLITIRVWLERDMLLCQVEDNGVGFANRSEGVLEPDELKHGKKLTARRERFSGIGIEHIRQKIKLYYGADYKLLIINKPLEGTTVRMSLPIHRNEE